MFLVIVVILILTITRLDVIALYNPPTSLVIVVILNLMITQLDIGVAIHVNRSGLCRVEVCSEPIYAKPEHNPFN